MFVTHLKLANWKNFREINVDIPTKLYLVGPNASGKSNFLDVLRFLHDVARQGGGLHDALERRGGLSKIRCLAARQHSTVEIEVHIQDRDNTKSKWIYKLGLAQEPRGRHETYVKYEQVFHTEKGVVLDRPDNLDKKDPARLYQTYLEQISANVNFREVATFFSDIRYFHLVPQLIKYSQAFSGPNKLPEDPFGSNFMEALAKTSPNIRNSRLKKIESILKAAVPQLTELKYTTDEVGFPHLEARYKHWRLKAGKQREIQFSDGTLRLIGLFWSLLDKHDAPLLLEEPELSLNAAIIRQLPSLIYNVDKKLKRKSQVFISTHSIDLLSNKSISGDEVLVLIPKKEQTEVKIAKDIDSVRILLDSEMSIADAVESIITPENLKQKELGDFIDVSR